MARMEPSYSDVVQALAGPQPGIVKVEASVAEPEPVPVPIKKVCEDLCTLQVVLGQGVDDDLKEKIIQAFKVQFTEVCKKDSYGRVDPTGFVLIREDGGIYLQFESVAKVIAVEALRSVRVTVHTMMGNCTISKRYTVSFEHTKAIREVYEKIEMLENRAKGIQQEYKKMGLTGQSEGKPRLPAHIMSKDDFGTFLDNMKKKRKAGEDLTFLEMNRLKNHQAMDTAPIKKRIDELWAEEQDLWIALREERLKLLE